MLGIRRYKNVALDLFQGEPTRFACDGTAEPTRASLQTVEMQGCRHIAISIAGPDARSPVEVMAEVKSYLEERTLKTLGRITFILPSIAVYEDYQRTLFATFPET